jgi:hypothetical protein
MPWASAQKSLNAVRGCYGAAGRDPKKKAKCRKMAHEARLFRGNKRKSSRKKSRRMARR